MSGYPAPTVVVLRDADVVASSTAARLLTRLVDVQAQHGTASVVLAGGLVAAAGLLASCGSSRPRSTTLIPPPSVPLTTVTTPTKPAPSRPAPSKSAPTKPAPTKPAPTKPAPSKP